LLIDIFFMESSKLNAKQSSSQYIITQLLEKRLITKDDIAICSNYGEDDSDIVEDLLRLGLVSKSIIRKIKKESENIETFNTNIIVANDLLLKKLPYNLSVEYATLPLRIDEYNNLHALSTDDHNIIVEDELRKIYNVKEIKITKIEDSDLQQITNRSYNNRIRLTEILNRIEKEIESSSLFDNSESSVVEFINEIVHDAARNNVSDIHFEPAENFVRIRFRKQGIMYNRIIIDSKSWLYLLGRVKVIAGMNIAESNIPQDGAASFNFIDNEIECRISVLPSIHGENVVMRLLDQNKSIISLEKLGFSSESKDILAMAMNRPEGMIIVTGPTGSGKTTTLYSIVNEINGMDLNIMTLEDPVEYILPLIRQTNINHRAGLNFSEGLRSILRQDPDVILLGEMRDFETAEIAVRAAMTGHTVLSTLHTNSAIGAVNRLLDMGIEKTLLSESVNAIIGQRLVRKLCDKCKISDTQIPEELLIKLKHKHPNDNFNLCQPNGCIECEKTGYIDRIAIVEILFFNKKIRSALSNGKGIDEIYNLALQDHMTTMQDRVFQEIIEGSVSIHEACRNINMTDDYPELVNIYDYQVRGKRKGMLV
jgi:type II secretory ATPase GspE/PulE/Tfp pilus assembly ATPase PilB-like protein